MHLLRTLRSATGRAGVRVGAVVGTLAALGLLTSSPAAAATSTIDHVQRTDDAVQVLVSVSGVAAGEKPDLATVTASFDGDPVEAEARMLSDGQSDIRRTAILALDVSKSMRGQKFEAAKQAADTFLGIVPDDVYVGLVTFADDVRVAVAPTRDHGKVHDALDGLQLSSQTHLYDGVRQAVSAAGRSGSRSILVLTDGRDTSGTPLSRAMATVKKARTKLDVVALAQSASQRAVLQRLADSGKGQVLSADDAGALRNAFAAEAKALARQVLVTVHPTAEMAGKEGNMSVTLQVAHTPATAQAFVVMPSSHETTAPLETRLPPVEPGITVPTGWMYGGLAAATLGVVVALVAALGGRSSRRDDIDRSIEAYTRKGAKLLAEANRTKDTATNASVTQQAVAVAENVLENRKGLETALDARLDAAGMALRPAEWLLIHAAVVLGCSLFGLLLGSGNPLFLLLGLFLGAALPWGYLLLKKSRRLAAFKTQLADTLQLMAGSLSAGLSLAQSVDTVVREGSEPMSAEFRRAIVETRLGVEIEEALAGVAERMESVDFEWVVMAIRIQREVGGNLSELLNKVADTIREREYLERQVKTLSAEGRLSVWILGGLPPAFMAYLTLVNPGYIGPMFSSPLGWMMLTVMVVLLTVGIFWMKKCVKVVI